jgi:hemerythrin
MPLIQWNESLSVSINEIDTQHRKLFALINELDQAQHQGKGKEVVGKIVNGLISYTREHFKNEEDYFDRHNYPDAASHKKAHMEFVAKVTEFRDNLLKNKIGLSMDLMQFLSEWLKKHILVIDMKYVPFFKEHGIK